jgi:hypothetical protein
VGPSAIRGKVGSPTSVAGPLPGRASDPLERVVDLFAPVPTAD